MTRDESTPARVRRAYFCYQIISPLLASPPPPGELAGRLDELAEQTYEDPITGEPVRFGRSTIERWLYTAREKADPIRALTRKVSSRAGSHPSVGEALEAAIVNQFLAHPRWSYQLHYDNLKALERSNPTLGAVPSYGTIQRYMKDHGLVRARAKKVAEQIARHIAPRETRSFESSHVGTLWHLDFHVGSRRVLSAEGRWVEVRLFGVIDDYSRLGCHLQWYEGPGEPTQVFVHGFSQALQKRGLPRGALMDSGAGAKGAETKEGLKTLGIRQYFILARSPEQNAKMENFWALVEGRLMPMMEGEKELTLELLNKATLAWLEMEYNRRVHSEIGTTPLDRFVNGPSVLRPRPSSDELRKAFRREERRTQRRSDGTLTVGGIRYEIPSRYRTLLRPTVCWASWDLSSVDMVDPRTGTVLATLLPLDKQQNADGKRRVLDMTPDLGPAPAPSGIAPLLREYMADYAATGLPPAYVPFTRNK